MIIGKFPGSSHISKAEIELSHNNNSEELSEYVTLVLRTGAAHIQTYLDRKAVLAFIIELQHLSHEDVA